MFVMSWAHPHPENRLEPGMPCRVRLIDGPWHGQEVLIELAPEIELASDGGVDIYRFWNHLQERVTYRYCWTRER